MVDACVQRETRFHRNARGWSAHARPHMSREDRLCIGYLMPQTLKRTFLSRSRMIYFRSFFHPRLFLSVGCHTRCELRATCHHRGRLVSLTTPPVLAYVHEPARVRSWGLMSWFSCAWKQAFEWISINVNARWCGCLLYTSPSPRD